MGTETKLEALAVVIPAYNAGDLLRGVLEQVCPWTDTIIVVDDGSTDGCVEAAADFPVTVVRHSHNMGKGAALVTGYAEALQDPQVSCVAVLDADGQHNADELPGLYNIFHETQADFLIGARAFTRQDVPFRSWFGNRVTILVSGLLLGKRLPDTQSGFRLVSRRYLEAELPGIRGGRYETEMEMLGKALRGEYVVGSEPIQTIYEDGNPSSHFNVIRDSYLIYRTLAGLAMKRLFS